MQLVIPTRLDEKLVRTLDELVSRGLYVSRSEAIRDAIRRLTTCFYVSSNEFMRVVASIAAEVILANFESAVTDIVLFGSVARGEAGPDSDVDLLVLVRDGAPVSELRRELHKLIYPISLASDVPITLVVLTRGRFLKMLENGFSFAIDIVRTGIQFEGDVLEVARGKSSSR